MKTVKLLSMQQIYESGYYKEGEFDPDKFDPIFGYNKEEEKEEELELNPGDIYEVKPGREISLIVNEGDDMFEGDMEYFSEGIRIKINDIDEDGLVHVSVEGADDIDFVIHPDNIEETLENIEKLGEDEERKEEKEEEMEDFNFDEEPKGVDFSKEPKDILDFDFGSEEEF